MMTTAKLEELERIVSIIKAELPKCLSPDFRVNDVKAGYWAGTEAKDFVHVFVILEDDHPELDVQMRIDFRRKMRDHFDYLGIDRPPVITLADRSDFIR